LPATERPQSLRLTLLDGKRLELRKARMVGDSLIGETVMQSGHTARFTRTAVAVREIRQLEDRRVSTLNTVGAIVGIGGVALVAAVAVAAASVQCIPFGCQ
jgi:hypothetical protein